MEVVQGHGASAPPRRLINAILTLVRVHLQDVEKPPQDCLLTDWKDWSDCTATCGGGQMVRMRRVKSEAKSGGLPCNNTISETIPCGTDACRLGKKVVNCLWGEWGPFGACDKCGGQKRRYRHIEKTPEHGGLACEHKASEEFMNCTRHCHDRQYCVWSDWSDYGECTTTCGAGSKKRNRTLKLLQKMPEVAAPPPEKLYDTLRVQAQQVESSRTQEMVIAFACGCVSFVVLLSVGRAWRSSSVEGTDTRNLGLE